MSSAHKTSDKKLPPLYIIHGWTYTTEPWTTTLSLLKDQGFNIKMLNVPGLTSPSEKTWTINDYVSWARKNIPAGSVALGHSNGGRILLNLSLNDPTYLHHLILLDSAGVYEPSKKRDFLRKLSKLFTPVKKNRLFRKIFHKLIGANDYSRAPESMKQTLTNMLDSDRDLTPRLPEISTPTTILWGEQDNITPPRQAKKLHTALKNSTLTFYPTWTHAPYISDPTSLAQALSSTLANLEKAPARSNPSEKK